MMVGILQYLYDRPETFAEQIALMKTAQPDEYLRSGSCEYEIAQKYGAKVYGRRHTERLHRGNRLH